MFDFDGINFVANGIQFASYDVIEIDKIKIDHKIRCLLEKAKGNWRKRNKEMQTKILLKEREMERMCVCLR